MGLVVPQGAATQRARRQRSSSPARPRRRTMPQPAADWAEQSLATTVDAMDRLAAEYAQQALDAPPRASHASSHPGSASTWAASCPNANVARQLVSTFNMVSLPLTWRTIEAVEGRRNWNEADAQVEWAHSAGLRISAGPLLELDDRGVPDWTYLWEGDFDSLLGVHARPRPRRRRALSRQSPPLASGRAHDARPRARPQRRSPPASRRQGDQRPSASSIPRRRSSSRSTSRGPSTWPASISISRRCTLPTRWSAPTWASPASGWKSTSAITRADRSTAGRSRSAG